MKLARSITLASASTILDHALALGRKESMLPMTVVVLDSGGHIVAMKSEDGSGVVRFNVALGKAFGALGMGMSSRSIRDRMASRPQFQNAIMAASEGRMIPVPGGVLIEDAAGVTVGAVGISGDTSEKDEYCAISAIRHAGFASDPATVDENWRTSSLCGGHGDEATANL